MVNNVYDLVVKVTKNQAIASVSTGYIKKICIAVKPLQVATKDNGIYLITSKEEIAEYTDNTSVQVAFNSGASSVYIYVDDTLTNFSNYLESFDSSLFYTFLISNDFSELEVGDFDSIAQGTYDGGVVFATKNDAFYDVFSVDNSAFVSDSIDSAIHSYITMFNNSIGASWKNIQLATDSGTEATPVETVGEGDLLYEKRVNYYISDTVLGNRLGSFFDAKMPVVSRYVMEEIKIKVQDAGVSYIANNQPYLTISTKRLLVEEYKKILIPYVDAGVLNQEYNINIIDGSSDEFTVNFKIDIIQNPPLWRQNIQLNLG